MPPDVPSQGVTPQIPQGNVSGIRQSTSRTPARQAIHQIDISEDAEGHEQAFKLQLPFALGAGNMYRDAFLSVVQERCQIGTSEESSPADTRCAVRVGICCTGWVTTICIEAQSANNQILTDVLLSFGLSILSKSKQDESLQKEGLKLRERGLRNLREAIQKYVKAGEKNTDANMLAMTMLASAMAEILVNKSWETYNVHLKGVGALIEFAGPSALVTPVARDNFYGYRVIQTIFDFIHRKGSFFARPEWTDFPWKRQHPLAMNVLHMLTDIAVGIPVEMELFDSRTTHSQQDLETQLRKLLDLKLQLDDWESELSKASPSPIYTTTTVTVPNPLSKEMAFHNLGIANAFTFYTGVRVALLSLILQVTHASQSNIEQQKPKSTEFVDQVLEWSVVACQCINYFTNIERNTIGKLVCLFPLDMIWLAFWNLKTGFGIESRSHIVWCQQVADKFSRMGLPALRIR